MITLASVCFVSFFRFLHRACDFWLRRGRIVFRPLLFAYPHDLFSCGPFIGILGFFGVRQSCSCAGVDRRGFYSADSSASLAQCGLGGGFLPSFAIFALVWDLLRNFRFYSLASLLGLPFLLCLSLLLSLSPTVAGLRCFSCRPHSLVVPVFVFGGFSFCSHGAVSSSSLLLGVGAGSCWDSLVCVFSLSWGTCGFSALCLAAGYPSGVPHLADSDWLPYFCGDDFAWCWGCLGTVVLLPPCTSSWCMRSFPLGFLHPSRVS